MEEKTSNRSENARKQFMLCVKTYTELHKLVDLVKVVTIGRPILREDLKWWIISIFESTDSKEVVISDLELWYDALSNAFYQYCDDLPKNDGLDLMGSLDGVRFEPQFEVIADYIVRINNGSQDKG